MKIIDELYDYYRNKLTGDEEDIDMLTFAFLEEMSREDILTLIEELDNQELYNLMGLYVIESLKGKFAESDFTKPQNYH
ncbi:DUF6154 family protein [Cytobacillus sp. FSL W7-1323]|uniref:Cytosolic protein n=1 Tax=Cytobacillus kochii TaxID=859143 RepID=A0A248TK35_9BACI|nr:MULTISPECIES: DUF6154 family protein [Cytobacillus]ASV68588.1 hypothetical protein CKF48_15630 [Cytobacillus kochii]MCM3322948.1 DUF6154 family protein [Cytobacillus kochii]MCM3345344.1 DUF6154 family protein [Cytobacillus kochii]MDM5208918.1 DUF6154 family protein [Cytobacillus kochii]MDQ0186119.1 glycosylphosphatidylinositol transamidase (GPIT) subunit GPI8 [Cytobacillus kochii]